MLANSIRKTTSKNMGISQATALYAASNKSRRSKCQLSPVSLQGYIRPFSAEDTEDAEALCYMPHRAKEAECRGVERGGEGLGKEERCRTEELQVQSEQQMTLMEDVTCALSSQVETHLFQLLPQRQTKAEKKMSGNKGMCFTRSERKQFSGLFKGS
ncbi:hypothetical protein SRHO_G00007720 [Serrasalmus rhombeus]